MVSDIDFLWRHIEASWGLSVPPLTVGDTETPSATVEGKPHPPWALYFANVGGGEVRIWRLPVADRLRPTLLAGAMRGMASPFGRALEGGHAGEAVFRFEGARPGPHPSPAPEPPPAVRILGEHDRALLEAFEPGESAYYLATHRAPVVGVVAGDRLVTIAHSSRRTAHACELGIGTLMSARRLGYARAATVAWTHAICAEGLVPIYSAAWANVASHALAVSCGYRLLCRAIMVNAV